MTPIIFITKKMAKRRETGNLFPHSYRTMQGQDSQDGKPGRYAQHKIGEELFDLSTDPMRQRMLPTASGCQTTAGHCRKSQRSLVTV